MLSACGKWPPYKDEIVDNFHDKRAAMEALEAAYDVTDYWDISFGVGESAKTTVEIEGGRTNQKLDDGTNWHGLLVSANVYRIQKTDYGNEFELLIPGKKDKRFISRYIHEPGRESKFKECQDDYSDVPCGICSISFDSGWWFQTRWSPNQILSDEQEEKVGTGAIDFDEARVLSAKALRACYIDGYKQLGYPVPKE